MMIRYMILINNQDIEDCLKYDAFKQSFSLFLLTPFSTPLSFICQPESSLSESASEPLWHRTCSRCEALASFS